MAEKVTKKMLSLAFQSSDLAKNDSKGRQSAQAAEITLSNPGAYGAPPGPCWASAASAFTSLGL
jgi:hypothetical protein